MTYEPKTKAGKFVLDVGMMVSAQAPGGGIVNWEAFVQDMEQDAAKLERQRLWEVVTPILEMLPMGYGRDPRFVALWDAFHPDDR